MKQETVRMIVEVSEWAQKEGNIFILKIDGERMGNPDTCVVSYPQDPSRAYRQDSATLDEAVASCYSKFFT